MVPLWPFFALTASALQIVRNTAQRKLTESLGIWGASYVRFAYGLPFGCLWLAAIIGWRGASGAPSAPFLAWVLSGAICQGAAMVLLMVSMRGRGFGAANALSKTEALGATALSALLIGDAVGPLQWGGAALATGGVAVLTRASLSGDAMRAALAGAAAGGFFSISSVSYRAGALAWGGDGWVAAAATLVGTLTAQTLIGAGLLALFDRKALVAVGRAWRDSLLPGASGAAASALLFTAFAFAPSAGAVKTVQLADVPMAWAVSRRVFREGLSRTEALGGAMILAGAALVLAQ